MRRQIIEEPLTKSKRPKSAKWQVVEKALRGNAGVVVSKLDLPVPRFSFQVGTIRMNDEGDDFTVGPRLTVFNAVEAAELLRELGEKYTDIREAKIDDIEKKKEAWASSQAD